MGPSNPALVDGVDAAWKELAAFFRGDAQLIGECGLRLRGSDPICMSSE